MLHNSRVGRGVNILMKVCITAKVVCPLRQRGAEGERKGQRRTMCDNRMKIGYKSNYFFLFMYE